jgi:hypothetical protein
VRRRSRRFGQANAVPTGRGAAESIEVIAPQSAGEENIFHRRKFILHKECEQSLLPVDASEAAVLRVIRFGGEAARDAVALEAGVRRLRVEDGAAILDHGE